MRKQILFSLLFVQSVITDLRAQNCTIPTAPPTSGSSTCNGSNAAVSASGCSDGVIQWWSADRGGTLLHTGSIFITPPLTSNTTYYAECVVGTCSSIARTPATVSIATCSAISHPVFNNVTITPTPSICTTDSIKITVNYKIPQGSDYVISRPTVQGNIITLPFIKSPCGSCNLGTKTATFTIPPQAVGTYKVVYSGILFSNPVTYPTLTVNNTCASNPTCPDTNIIKLENIQIESRQDCKSNVRFTLTGAPPYQQTESIFFGGYKVSAWTTGAPPLSIVDIYQVKDCVDSTRINSPCLSVVDTDSYCFCNGVTSTGSPSCYTSKTGYVLNHNGRCTGTEKVSFTVYDVPSGSLKLEVKVPYYKVISGINGPINVLQKECTYNFPINVTGSVPSAVTPPAITLCNTNTVNLKASDPIILNGQSGTVQWFSNAAATQAIPNPNTYSVSGNTPVYAQVVNGSCRSNIVQLSIQITNLPPSAGRDTSLPIICVRNSGLSTLNLFNLLRGAETGGVWSVLPNSQQPGAAFNSATGILNPNGLGVGIYRFQYQIINNCGQDAKSVTVTIGNQLTANAGSSDVITCPKKSVLLRGSSNSTSVIFRWTFPSGRTRTSDTITTQEKGIHTLTVIDANSNCSATSTVDIRADTISPSLSIQSVGVNCYDGKDGKITVTASGGVPPFKYQLNTDTFTTNNVFRNLRRGDYTVKVQGANLCMSSTSASVNAPAPFTIKIKELTCKFFFERDNIQLQADKQGGFGNVRFNWTSTPSVNLSCTNCTTPKFILLKNTTLKITATDTTNCTAQDSVSFTAKSRNIPDVITPNGDGANDFFELPDLQDCGSGTPSFPNNELIIINRWGTVVFRQKDYKNNWAGTNQNNDPLPQGTYFYTLRLNLSDAKIYKGDILIIR
jgi:gliding motility-associated-like protein